MTVRAFFLLFFSWCAVIPLFGQEKDSIAKPVRAKFPETGGLVAYYFWEEDSLGVIQKNDISKPFLQNFFILKKTVKLPPNAKPDKQKGTPATQNQIEKAINYFAHDSGSDPEEDEYALLDSTKHIQKIRFPLVKAGAENYAAVTYRKKNNEWESMKRRTVLYFSIDSSGAMRFSHSSDSVTLFDYKVNRPSNAQYMVWNYMRGNGKLDFQRVYNYEGNDVTLRFAQTEPTTPVRMLVFANGYRGPKKNNDPTDGLVTRKDRYTYWYKLDNQFIKALQPDVTYYIDGSFPIATSNHRTKLGFAKSYVRVRYGFRRKKSKRIFAALNTKSNPEGFQERKEKGKTAGLAFLYARCSSPECAEVKDTIDIVCHSMGYAYSLGFIEAIRSKAVLGNMYIIAAENACTEGMDWSAFQQVWQYGTNLDQEDAFPLNQQDGIAPQCAVKGLDKLPPERGGRAFFPKDWPNMNFVDSHMVYSYDWIFEIKAGETGFVRR